MVHHRRRSAQGVALIVGAMAVAAAMARKSKVQLATVRRFGIAAGVASGAAILQRRYMPPDQKNGTDQRPARSQHASAESIE